MDNLVDLHTHILPGLDDGPDSIKESVRMAKALQDMGFAHVFATPHHRYHSWKGIAFESVRSGLHELKEALSRKGLDIQLYPGIEYDLDDALMEKDQDHLGEAGHLLVDIGFWDVPFNLPGHLNVLRALDVEILLVHPERNGALCRQPGMLKSLTDSGIHLVGNLGSLSGFYGNEIRRDSLDILQAGFYWAMASDLHSLEQVFWVRNGLAQLRQEAGLAGMRDLMLNNPTQIIKSMVEEKP